MGLDIRLPIGMLFTIFGIMLIAFGVFSNPALYVQSLGVNINLNWGIILLIFGVIMLFLGARSMFFSPRPPETPNAESREPRH
jgi:multisubunit Na+/H+ antiporter MnhG subunit